MKRSALPIFWLAAASCVFVIGAHAGGRDGFSMSGESPDPAMIPGLLDPGLVNINSRVTSEHKERKTSTPARAVRCFELKRTFRASFWNSCLASGSVDSDCGDVAACNASGAFGLVEERKAMLCDSQRLIVPMSKWKACNKRQNTKDAAADEYCARVLQCEAGVPARYP